ncbi:MAG: hypothetical protein K9I29_05180 [Bacteroidales bacterium]|nr:hypothetical protein [Bacteroidales bacterium]MCF8327666.1 hypothetical protein [Bacteroidales bacterium]
MAIKRNISIEELTDNYPFSVSFLREKGIVCIVCGEPVWGTLEEVAKSKGFDDAGIDKLVKELNEKANSDDEQSSGNEPQSFTKDIGNLDKSNS